MNVASCTVADCDRPHRARGYCSTHYTRWRSNGDPNKVLPNNHPRGGGYSAVHRWLYKHYGKADRCDNPNCSGQFKRYHWAKLTEKTYDHKRENFIRLCTQCHRLYDQQRNWIERMAQSLANRTNKEYCRNGHKRTPENTYWAKRKLVIAPVCRDCRNESNRRYYASR